MLAVIDIRPPRVLCTDDEYDVAVAEIDRLLDLDPRAGSEDYGRLELLSLLVEDYDSRNDPLDDSDLTP